MKQILLLSEICNHNLKLYTTYPLCYVLSPVSRNRYETHMSINYINVGITYAVSKNTCYCYCFLI